VASSHQRIDELLAEGQASFERSEHQAAIDAWSRIFLIDIDHDAARHAAITGAPRRSRADG
jgi:hypothetical protein